MTKRKATVLSVAFPGPVYDTPDEMITGLKRVFAKAGAIWLDRHGFDLAVIMPGSREYVLFKWIPKNAPKRVRQFYQEIADNLNDYGRGVQYICGQKEHALIWLEGRKYAHRTRR